MRILLIPSCEFVLMLPEHNPLFEKGWGSGYVLIPSDHPAWGKDIKDINVDVHGGLTFSQIIDEETFGWARGTLLNEEDFGYHVIGFDTNHMGDDHWSWPRDRVKKETLRLRAQLINMKLQVNSYSNESLDFNN